MACLLRRRSFQLSYTFVFMELLMLMAGGSAGLRDVRVSIPPAVLRGGTAVLHCLYQLDSDALYSVKWYKGDREFFRYSPKETPSRKFFPIQGLLVDLPESDASKVVLKKVEPSLSGRYSCEVSADAPSFRTYLVSDHMDVVEVPSDRPTISGLKPRYRVDDILRCNCSTSWSRPAARLVWLINDEQAPREWLVPHAADRDPRTHRERARLGLRFRVTPQHFAGGGRLKIRCIASIHDIYWQSTEKSVEEERPRVLPPQPVQVLTTRPPFIPDDDPAPPPPHETIPSTGSFFCGSIILLVPVLLAAAR